MFFLITGPMEHLFLEDNINMVGIHIKVTIYIEDDWHPRDEDARVAVLEEDAHALGVVLGRHTSADRSHLGGHVWPVFVDLHCCCHHWPPKYPTTSGHGNFRVPIVFSSLMIDPTLLP
ncbi:hypothetical protein EJB05_06230 [Eragrostis curvula]|uniref:Uncharacterized protein n=1 Tax=Eragrostis curvula TaxID=38414 RepID=A0A5J9WH35_9POAL|nr:hypothetical protein EJB05_06230 [Eragrostis curvula]